MNGFAAYRGKAHLKDSIREGMVGHQTVVLSFETSEHVTVNLILFKEWNTSEERLVIFLFDSIVTCAMKYR